MSMIDMNKAGRNAIVVAQMMLLCACNMLAPASSSSHGSSEKPAANPKPAVAASAVGNEPTLNEHNVIEPSPAVAKAGLEVSFSVKPMSFGKEELMQLSLVFRNTTNKPLQLAPKVSLSDAQGAAVPVYSKSAFNQVAAKMIANSKKSPNSSSIKEQLEWDKAFWLGKSFTIPAGGILIGGLVFHTATPLYPMKLAVESEGQVYPFTLKGQAANVPAAEDKKAGDCHSPALGTALYVGSKPACRK